MLNENRQVRARKVKRPALQFARGMKMNDTPIVAFLIPFASREVKRFYFLQVNDPIPWDENHALALKLDKSANFAAAWSYAKPTWNPSYVIKIHADDLIGSKLVVWLENAGCEAGYLLKSGWLCRSGSRYLVQYKVAIRLQHCVEQHYFTEKFVILYKIFGRRMKAADYQSTARYWFDYLSIAAGRRRSYGRSIAEIQSMKFDAGATKASPRRLATSD